MSAIDVYETLTMVALDEQLHLLKHPMSVHLAFELGKYPRLIPSSAYSLPPPCIFTETPIACAVGSENITSARDSGQTLRTNPIGPADLIASGLAVVTHIRLHTNKTLGTLGFVA